MKIEPREIAEIAEIAATQSPAPRVDLYAGIHKALRAFMADTLLAVGRTDPADAQEVAATRERLGTLLDLCAGQHLALLTLQMPDPSGYGRIVRDAGEMPTLSAFNVSTIYELTLYTVQTDGKINYPFLGPIPVAGRQPSELATQLTHALAATYREPRVTVNINQAPGNSVIVGGAVNNPTAVQITM